MEVSLCPRTMQLRLGRGNSETEREQKKKAKDNSKNERENFLLRCWQVTESPKSPQGNSPIFCLTFDGIELKNKRTIAFFEMLGSKIKNSQTHMHIDTLLLQGLLSSSSPPTLSRTNGVAV